jgi:ABC-type multidrug transport system fused ATPase/permease subunit
MFHSINYILRATGPFKNLTVIIFIVITISAFVEALGLTLIIPMTSIILNDEVMESDSTAIKLFNEAFNYFVEEDKKVISISVLFFLVFLFKNALIFSRDILVVNLQYSLIRYWSVNMLDKYLSARYSYIKTQKKGVMMNNVITEPIYAAKFIGKTSTYLSRIILAIAIFISLVIVDWETTLSVGTIVLILFGVYMKFSQLATKNIGSKRLALMQKISKISEQSLTSIKHLKMLNVKKQVLDNIYSKFSLLRKVLIKLTIYKNTPKPAGELLILFTFFSFILFYDSYSSLPINNILPMMAFTLIAVFKLYQIMSDIIASKLWINTFFPSLKLISSQFDEDFSEDIQTTKFSAPLTLKKEITFSDVSFEYKGGKNIINDLNIKIKKNSVTAIVGESGSGKSTIIDILCMLLYNYHGKITFDDLDIKEIDLNTWRNNISYVNSDDFILDATIRDNLNLGNTNINEQKMVKAAELSKSQKFIEELESGFSFFLQESGSNLSSGQKQRLMITRAFLKNSGIIIFDEGTSFLDSDTEKYIYDAFKELKCNKTIILVTHRLRTLKNADIIYFIKNGILSESGNYDELINNKGDFYELINSN